jgi:hypothetical protein
MKEGMQTNHESTELDFETSVWIGLISSLMTVIIGEALFDWILASFNIIHFPEFGIPLIPLPPEEWVGLFGPWLYFIRQFVIVFPFALMFMFNIVFYRPLFLRNITLFFTNILICFSIALSILLTYALISQGRLFELNPRKSSLLPDPFSEILSLNYLIPFFIVIVAGYSLLFRYIHLRAKK